MLSRAFIFSSLHSVACTDAGEMQVELDILNPGEIVKRRKTRAKDEKSDPDCPIVITKKTTLVY